MTGDADAGDDVCVCDENGDASWVSHSRLMNWKMCWKVTKMVRNYVADDACVSYLPDCLRRKRRRRGYPRMKVRYGPAGVFCSRGRSVSACGVFLPGSGETSSAWDVILKCYWERYCGSGGYWGLVG